MTIAAVGNLVDGWETVADGECYVAADLSWLAGSTLRVLRVG